MAKRGRKNKYETHVKPFLNQIKKWSVDGATERQIAKRLGIAYSTFNDYKVKNKELSELLKNGRIDLVEDLRGTLVKRAKGFKYTETKTTTEQIKMPDVIKRFLETNGFPLEDLENPNLVRTEKWEKYAQPDVAALNLALKNYDADNWANDPQHLKLKREELELKKKQIEINDW